MSVDVGSAVGYLDIDISGFLSGLETALNQTQSAKNKIESLGNKISGVGNKLNSVGKTLTTTVTTPILGLGAAGLKVATDFEKGMSEVKAITQATSEDFNDLRDVAIDLGASTAFSAGEVAAAMTEMAKAGWNSQQIIAGMSGVLDAAAASGEDLGIVSTIVADAITGFGLEAADSARVADLLTQAANSGTIGITDLGESFKYIAPLAQSVNFSIEDVTTAISAMSMAGIKGSQAGTSLRTMITNLVKPTDQIEAAMEELGLEVTNTDGTLKSLDEIVTMMRSSFEDLTDEQKSYYAATLAGKEGMSGLLSLLNLTQEEYDAISGSMKNASGVAQETASVMQDNLQSKIEQLVGSLESLAIVMADYIIPHLQSFIEWLTGLVEKFTELDPATQKTILTIAGIAAAVGPVILVVGKLVSGFGSLVTGIGKVTSLFGQFGGVATAVAAPAEAAGKGVGSLAKSALNLLAAGAGIMLAATGLALLAQSSIALANAGWPAIAVLGGLVVALVGLAAGAAAIAPALTAGSVGLLAFGAAIALVGAGILAATGGVALLATQLPTISTYGSSAAEALVELGGGFMVVSEGAFAASTSCGMLDVTVVALLIPLAALTLELGACSLACGLLTTSMGATTVAATAMSQGVSQAIEGGLGGSTIFINGLISQASTWGQDLIQGLINGLNSSLGSLKDTVSNVAETIWSYLHFSVPEEGPLTSYESWMPDFMEGLAGGIKDNAYLVGDAVEGVAEQLKIEPEYSTESLFTASDTESLKEYNITLVNTLELYRQLVEQMKLCAQYSLGFTPRDNGLLRANQTNPNPNSDAPQPTNPNPDGGRKPDVLNINLQVGEEQIETVVVDLLRREVRT